MRTLPWHGSTHAAPTLQRACHPLLVGKETSGIVREDFLFQTWTFRYVFVSPGCSSSSILWVQFLCATCKLCLAPLFQVKSLLSLSHFNILPPEALPSLTALRSASWGVCPTRRPRTLVSHHLPEGQAQRLSILGR